MRPAEAARDVEDLLDACDLLEDGSEVTDVLLKLCRTAFAGRQVHDANIAATMLAHGENEILTFNVVDFVRFAPAITTIVP